MNGLELVAACLKQATCIVAENLQSLVTKMSSNVVGAGTDVYQIQQRLRAPDLQKARSASSDRPLASRYFGPSPVQQNVTCRHQVVMLPSSLSWSSSKEIPPSALGTCRAKIWEKDATPREAKTRRQVCQRPTHGGSQLEPCNAVLRPAKCAHCYETLDPTSLSVLQRLLGPSDPILHDSLSSRRHCAPAAVSSLFSSSRSRLANVSSLQRFPHDLNSNT